MLTIRQMIIFAAVVRHGSFRACAEQAGLTQVVVSAHIRELESRLGVSLFERRPGHAAALTTKGQHAFERISAILADLNDLQRELTGEQTRRTLNLTTYGFIMLKLQDRIDAFEDARPQIELHIRLDPPDNRTLAMQVHRGEVDLACFYTMDQDEVPGSVHVGHEQLAIYVGPDHPLAHAKGVTGAELGRHPAIMLRHENPQRRLTDLALDRIGAVPGKIILETDALALMLNNVRRNRAWICLFQDSVDDMIPGLVRVDLATPLPPVEIRLLSRPSARHDANLIALRDSFCG